MLGPPRTSVPLTVLLLLILVGSVWGLLGSTVQAATLTVTKIADTNDGACDADCSLREAIATANPGDTVNIPAGFYTLTLGFEITIGKDLTLTGAGADNTIIQSDSSPGVATYRVFDITSGNVAISGVTVRHGNEPAGDVGGGINNHGALTLTDSMVLANATTNGGGGIANYGSLILNNTTVSVNTAGGNGGGMYNESLGTLSLTSSTISGNMTSGLGGGIFNKGGVVTFTDSMASGNTAFPGTGGIHNDLGTVELVGSIVSGNRSFDLSGGIFNNGGVLIVTNSIVHGNSGAPLNNGGIHNSISGIAELTHTTVSDNLADGLGAGIRNFGMMTLDNSTVTGNTSDFGVSSGAGIYNAGTLTLTNSTISGNTSIESGGGIFNIATLTLIDSTVSGNTADLSGSGIYNDGELTLIGSFVIDNTGQGGGGGITNDFLGTLTITNSTISGNTIICCSGGGIFNSGTLTLTDSTVSNNTGGSASNGGGIFNDGVINPGTATVTRSTISGNQSDADGGGIANFGTFTLSDSTVSGNADFSGGGISNRGTLTIANSTISHNTATADHGGGILNGESSYPFGTVNLINSTVTENTAVNEGGGIRNFDTVELVNTIIALNTGTSAPDCSGSLTSLGHNLIRDGTDCSGVTDGVNGDQVGTGASPIDPKLGPLADNGGLSETHALLSGSQALDVGDAASCPATDQRGIARPQGANCDIGAFELEVTADNTPPIITVPGELTEEATSAAGATVNFTVTANDDQDPSPSITCNPSSGSVFPLTTTTVDCTATDASGNFSSDSFSVTVEDTTPPDLSIPDVVLEAESSEGASHLFPAIATDDVDGVIVAVCDRPSGSTFPIGPTTVECEAIDSSGNIGTDNFTITVDYFGWVHEVKDPSGTKTVPNASFWGLVSHSDSENFLGPFDQDRQDGLDPVNVVFFTRGPVPAVGLAAIALLRAGWTGRDYCKEAKEEYASLTEFAYFSPTTADSKEQLIDLYEYSLFPCTDQRHIRLFVPDSSSSWALGGAHDECALTAFPIPHRPECLKAHNIKSPIPFVYPLGGWEAGEERILEDISDHYLFVDNWTADLHNTTASVGLFPCSLGGAWRNNLGDDICHDGVTEVFELSYPDDDGDGIANEVDASSLPNAFGDTDLGGTTTGVDRGQCSISSQRQAPPVAPTDPGIDFDTLPHRSDSDMWKRAHLPKSDSTADPRPGGGNHTANPHAG